MPTVMVSASGNSRAESETGKRQMDNKQENYRYVRGDGGGDFDGVAGGGLSKGLLLSTER